MQKSSEMGVSAGNDRNKLTTARRCTFCNSPSGRGEGRNSVLDTNP
jgi:hypothetical protein